MTNFSNGSTIRGRLALIFVLMAVAIVASACGGAGGQEGQGVSMAPMSMLPDEMQTAPVLVRESYQFALANPEVLKEIPCYCGCGPMGHTSNYSCYIQSDEGGEIEFDTHALGCGICVDITQDTMRMLKDGKTTTEIRTAIDATYSKFGPSNIP